MFHCRYDKAGRKPLNAILPKASPQAPERIAPILNPRDLDMLQELAELGMQLARLAARQAQQDEAAEPPRPRRADPRLIFLRLSSTIRDTIILKTRLAAGILPPPPRQPREPGSKPQQSAAAEPEDPRRALILRYFREGIDLTRQKSKIATSQQIVEEHVDAELAKDPKPAAPAATSFCDSANRWICPSTPAACTPISAARRQSARPHESAQHAVAGRYDRCMTTRSPPASTPFKASAQRPECR